MLWISQKDKASLGGMILKDPAASPHSPQSGCSPVISPAPPTRTRSLCLACTSIALIIPEAAEAIEGRAFAWRRAALYLQKTNDEFSEWNFQFSAS